MPDGTVSATEADRNFTKMLRDVEDGAEVTITRDGRPVARLVPVRQPDPAKREEAMRRLVALMEEGLPIGYFGGLDRDELHRR